MGYWILKQAFKIKQDVGKTRTNHVRSRQLTLTGPNKSICLTSFKPHFICHLCCVYSVTALQ